MKNILPPPNYKNLSKSGFWSILLLSMILIFNSCVPEEEPVAAPISDLQQAVEEAKSWFGPQEEFEVPVTSASNARVRNQIKKIHWNKAIVHEAGRVIEVEITYNTTSVPIRSAKTINDIKNKQKAAFFRLILEKREDGGFDKFILKYFPEGTSANQKKLEVNNYTVWSKDFSGDIQMISWDEQVNTGWYVEKGEKVYTYFPKSESGKKSSSNANAALNCTPIMEEMCFSYGDDNEQMDCSTGICELPEHLVEVECIDVIAYEDPNCSDQYNPGSGPGTYTGPTGPVPGGGSGSGSGGGSPGGSLPLVEEPEGYELAFEIFSLNPQPSTINWSTSTPSKRFMHLVSHIKKAKDSNSSSLNVKNIFTNWPPNIQANGPIKAYYANLIYMGKQIRVYYEIPVAEPWTSINPFGNGGMNIDGDCVIRYSRDIGNAPTAYFLFEDSDLCSYFQNYLL
jgi:hypothetical protein